jgi:hypothetical protein
METEVQYELSELSPSAFQRAYEEWSTDYPCWDWWDSTYEWKIEDGKARGFEIQKINFSGFWSQGDGACWQGYILLPEFLDWQDQQEKPPLTMHQSNLLRAAVENEMLETSVKVAATGSGCHEYTMGFNYGISIDALPETLEKGFFAGMAGPDFEDLITPHLGEIETTLLETARDYAREIYKALEEEHEYLTSEESFREQAESNEWLFTEEGEMI